MKTSRWLTGLALCASTAALGLPAHEIGSQEGRPGEQPLRLHVVLLGLGPAYAQGHPPQEQAGFAAHAARMNELARAGTVILGGPTLESFANPEPTGALLVVRAATAEEARAILAGDALVASGVMKVGEVRAFVPAVSSALPR